MGSLGPPARAMAVRSAFALFCFALLCGLAASSIQSETETDLTKEGEAARDEVLVEQAVESRAARGADKKNKIKLLREKCRENPKRKACKELAVKLGRTKNKRQKGEARVRRMGGKRRKVGKRKRMIGKKGRRKKAEMGRTRAKVEEIETIRKRS